MWTFLWKTRPWRKLHTENDQCSYDNLDLKYFEKIWRKLIVYFIEIFSEPYRVLIFLFNLCTVMWGWFYLWLLLSLPKCLISYLISLNWFISVIMSCKFQLLFISEPLFVVFLLTKKCMQHISCVVTLAFMHFILFI